MQDLQEQSMLGIIWIKSRTVVELLFIVSAVIIFLNLVLGVATLGKLLSPPSWVWVQMRVVTCICGFLVCLRVLDAYVCHRWRQSNSGKYALSVLLSILAFAFALDHQWWILAFPSLLVGFIVLSCIEIRLQLEKKHVTHRKEWKYTINQEKGMLQKQAAKWSSRRARKADNSTTHPSQKVFICYSHMDEKWVKLLRRHLRPLERQGIIDLWDDTKIGAGAIWKEEIEYAIRSAAAAVVLINVNFLASDFIMQYELPKLLWQAQARGTLIFPLFVGSCLYESSGLERFQAVNPPSKPLAEMTGPERDRVLVKLVKAICQRLAI